MHIVELIKCIQQLKALVFAFLICLADRGEWSPAVFPSLNNPALILEPSLQAF